MIAIVSHDAGGAELISSWLLNTQIEYCLCLGGPAKKIFHKKMGGNFYALSLDEAITESDWVICGSGWETNFELDAIFLAKIKKKRSVVFLDHWVNYRERFIHKKLGLIYPDEIWVSDIYAYEIAKKIFPCDVKISLIKNYYLSDLHERYLQIKNTSPCHGMTRALYICEPIASHALNQHGNECYWGYTEFSAIQYFKENIIKLHGDSYEVVIRLHPSELEYKYDAYIRETSIKFYKSKNTDLLNDIACADIVYGCESMALYIAAELGKRVISVIPPGGRPCQLPHKNIEYLKYLVE